MTLATDEVAAVADIRDQLAPCGPATVLLFCSPRYDLGRLSAELRRAFPMGVFGCTSSGEIGPAGYQSGGITAVAFAESRLRVTPYPIRPLDRVSSRAAEIGEHARQLRATAPSGSRAFGLFLIDGLSCAEERVVSALHLALPDVPLVGGSAGDELMFQATHVLVDGHFVRDAAMFLFVETDLSISVIKAQHFEPTGKRAVVTGAIPDRRVVTELDGKRADGVYARLVGRSVEELGEAVFAANPVMVKLDGQCFVRSIQKRNPDGSLTLFCAIDEGVVLHVGSMGSVVESLEGSFSELASVPEVVVAFDCIHRRLEFERQGLLACVGGVLAEHRVVGFSTYGEQYNGVHVNNTFTAIALAEG